MNSGATSERVYAALKRRILHRDFAPGDRLDPTALGDTLSSSATPVRDALHILVGEGLVTTRTSDGFHLPPLDAPALEDLYAWNAQVLEIAVQRTRLSRPGPPPDEAASADATAALFAAIAARSGNAEHGRAISSLNDRLHAIRVVEADVLAEVGNEIAALRTRLDDSRALRQAIASYHRRRIRQAADIVRALYRTRGPQAENKADTDSV